jgi:hypothetical protein
VIVAIGRGLVVDGFRVVAFVVGAKLLGGIVAIVAAFWLFGQGLGGSLGDPMAFATMAAALNPLASVVPVAEVTAVIVYLGIRLPARAARASTIPEAIVRRWVAAIGGALVWAASWLVLPMSLDPVLAVGYTLAPVAFAMAALRGPATPPILKGWRPYVLLAAAYGTGVAVMLLPLYWVPSAPPVLAAVGEPAASQAIGERIVDVYHWTIGPSTSDSRLTTLDLDWPIGEVPFSSIQVEVWPMVVHDGVPEAASPPLTVIPAAELGHRVRVAWPMPAPRDRRLVLTAAVGVLPDGRRLILDPEPDIDLTPAWHGTLLGWWFGG